MKQEEKTTMPHKSAAARRAECRKLLGVAQQRIEDRLGRPLTPSEGNTLDIQQDSAGVYHVSITLHFTLEVIETTG
jgi:hypothetical protein